MKKAISIFSALVVMGALAGVAEAGQTRAPRNDARARAVAVPALPFDATVDLRGSTLEEQEPSPSCAAIRGSVWYSFLAGEEANLVAELSSASRTVVAIFTETEEGLTELACSSGNAGEGTEFPVSAGSAYLVQVGAVGAKQGAADLSLRPSQWRDRTIYEYVFHRESEEQYVPIVSVKAGPRETDSSMYDVTFGVSQQQPVTVGLRTFGLVTQELAAELARIPASTTDIRLKISSRYDSSQYSCAADNGSDTCYAGAPVRDASWASSGEGAKSELVISIRAERNGTVLPERSLVVPYAGQLTGLLP